MMIDIPDFSAYIYTVIAVITLYLIFTFWSSSNDD